MDAVIHNKTADLENVAHLISPSVDRARREEGSDNLLEEAVKLNAKQWRDHLLKSPAIQRLMQTEQIAVHAGYYHLHSGKVELL